LFTFLRNKNRSNNGRCTKKYTAPQIEITDRIKKT